MIHLYINAGKAKNNFLKWWWWWRWWWRELLASICLLVGFACVILSKCLFVKRGVCVCVCVRIQRRWNIKTKLTKRQSSRVGEKKEDANYILLRITQEKYLMRLCILYMPQHCKNQMCYFIMHQLVFISLFSFNITMYLYRDVSMCV